MGAANRGQKPHLFPPCLSLFGDVTQLGARKPILTFSRRNPKLERAHLSQSEKKVTDRLRKGLVTKSARSPL